MGVVKKISIKCKASDASPMALFSNAIFNFKLISVPAYGDEVFRKAFLVNIVKNMKTIFF